MWDIPYISTNFSTQEAKILLTLKDKIPMGVKIYEYRGMTRASIKVFTTEQKFTPTGEKIPRQATEIDFIGGGNIGGHDGHPKMIAPQAAVHDELIQQKIEAHPLFLNGTIVLILNTDIDPNETIKFDDEEEEEFEIVEGVKTKNEAAFFLRNRFPDIKVTDINSKQKIKEIAEAKKLKFPNFNMD
jgi:hypothetical protein